MAYSIDPIQDNCYPGTTVLVNKLHIHDEAALQEAEALATYVNASKLEQCPLEGVFDFAHYKAIHQFLFSDLYDWAGQLRTVNLSKKGTDFCPAEEIEPQAKLIFDRLKEQNYFKGLPHDAFVEEITDFYCTTNYLHPFREGNTRTVVMMLTFFVEQYGFYMDQELLAASAGYVRDSFVMASLDQFSEYEHLERILLDAVCDEPILYDEASLEEDDSADTRSEKYKKYQTEKYIPQPHYKREN